jgi:hypothetical protein
MARGYQHLKRAATWQGTARAVAEAACARALLFRWGKAAKKRAAQRQQKDCLYAVSDQHWARGAVKQRWAAWRVQPRPAPVLDREARGREVGRRNLKARYAQFWQLSALILRREGMAEEVSRLRSLVHSVAQWREDAVRSREACSPRKLVPLLTLPLTGGCGHAGMGGGWLELSHQTLHVAAVGRVSHAAGPRPVLSGGGVAVLGGRAEKGSVETMDGGRCGDGAAKGTQTAAPHMDSSGELSCMPQA